MMTTLNRLSTTSFIPSPPSAQRLRSNGKAIAQDKALAKSVIIKRVPDLDIRFGVERC